MGQGSRGSGLVAAGLGWGVALGVALGTLLIAPAVNGTLDQGPFSRGATGAGEAGGAAESAADAASRQAQSANELLADVSSRLVSGALQGVPVTLVRTADSADEDAAAVRWLANTAGAGAAGSLTLTEKFFDQNSADELSSIIANTLPAGAQLSVEHRSPGTHAGQSLAAALAQDPDTGEGYAAAADRDLVLDALAEAGFVQVDGPVEPAGAIIVVAGEATEGFAGQALQDFTAALREQTNAVLATRGEAPNADAVGEVDTEAGRIRAVLAAGEQLPARG